MILNADHKHWTSSRVAQRLSSAVPRQRHWLERLVRSGLNAYHQLCKPDPITPLSFSAFLLLARARRARVIAPAFGAGPVQRLVRPDGVKATRSHINDRPVRCAPRTLQGSDPFSSFPLIYWRPGMGFELLRPTTNPAMPIATEITPSILVNNGPQTMHSMPPGVIINPPTMIIQAQASSR